MPVVRAPAYARDQVGHPIPVGLGNEADRCATGIEDERPIVISSRLAANLDQSAFCLRAGTAVGCGAAPTGFEPEPGGSSPAINIGRTTCFYVPVTQGGCVSAINLDGVTAPALRTLDIHRRQRHLSLV